MYSRIKSTSDKAKEIVLERLNELNIENSTSLFKYVESMDNYAELVSIYGDDISFHALINAFSILKRDIQFPIETFTKLCKLLDIEWHVTVVHPFLSKDSYNGDEMLLSRIVQECSYTYLNPTLKLQEIVKYSLKAPLSFSLFTRAMDEMNIAFKLVY